VKVTPDGVVKVLDFGLAKAFAGGTSATELAESPTITVEHTRPGVVLGTAAYMSPEQARGKPLDKRTDIWSFGCVLYECLTGHRAFDGETTSDVIAKILEHDPDFERLAPNTPPAIRTLLRHCLEKDRRQRLRDAGDAALELQEAITTRAWSTSALTAVTAPIPCRKRGVPLTLGVAVMLVLGAIIGVGSMQLLRSQTPVIPARLCISVPDSLRSVELIRLSPDGRTVVWIAREASDSESEESPTHIYTRRLDSFDVRQLTGTAGVEDYAISYSGRWLAFVAPISSETDKKQLAKIPLDGSSPPLHVRDWPEDWSTWIRSQVCCLPGGDIVVLTGEGDTFTRVPSNGGPSTPLRKIIRPDSTSYVDISSPLPNGRAVFVDIYSYAKRRFQIDVGILELDTAKIRVVMNNGSSGTYTSSGHLVFSRDDTLLAAPFNVDSLEITGGTKAIVDGLRTRSSWEDAEYGLSQDGSLVYAPGGRVGAHRRIMLVEQDGTLRPWAQERRAFDQYVAVSPDGTRLAVVVVNTAGLFEIWISEFLQPRLRRLVSAPDADCFAPVWSPNSERLVYSRGGKNERDGVYWCRGDGSDRPELLVKEEDPYRGSLEPYAWSADGSKVLLERWISGAPRDVFILDLASQESGMPKLTPLLDAPCLEAAPSFSPNDKWIVHSSDETGRAQVYIRAFQSEGQIGPAIPITTDGGDRPVWSPDGTAIFYRSKTRLMAVEVSPENAMPVSDPRVVLDFNDLRLDGNDRYSILSDGRLAVIQKGEEEGDITRVNVVLNWFEELKRRMPAEANK
jgi:serine/threonine-protein kinase